MTNLEVVKKLKGTYDMDTSLFYDALEAVITRYEKMEKIISLCDVGGGFEEIDGEGWYLRCDECGETTTAKDRFAEHREGCSKGELIKAMEDQ